MALGALRMSSENGDLQSTASGQDEKVLWPCTLGEGGAERVDTSRGKDGAKVESKWKENKRRKGEVEHNCAKITCILLFYSKHLTTPENPLGIT